MSNCCPSDYQLAFDAQKAREDLRDYRSAGVKKSTRPLLAALESLPLKGKSLLDIGGGIGALFFELQPKGLSRAGYVDLAPSYRQVFLEEAGRRGLTGLIRTHLGDFLDLHQQVEPADLVTLDKVICCYDNYEELVATSAAKARQWYIYTIPRNVWWVRWADQLERWRKRRRWKSFRTYVHPTDAIEKLVLQFGFRKRMEQRHREWLTVLYERKEGE